MLEMALILLITAGVAALFGIDKLSGAAMTVTKILLGLVLLLFLLVVLGVLAL